MDDEIDVDGEDAVVYGAPQFSEGDVLNPVLGSHDENDEVDIEDDSELSTSSKGSSGEPENERLNDLIAEAKGMQPSKNTVDGVRNLVGIVELAAEFPPAIGHSHCQTRAPTAEPRIQRASLRNRQ